VHYSFELKSKFKLVLDKKKQTYSVWYHGQQTRALLCLEVTRVSVKPQATHVASKTQGTNIKRIFVLCVNTKGSSIIKPGLLLTGGSKLYGRIEQVR
jgi:hypothetical protein